MHRELEQIWPLGEAPCVSWPMPQRMEALTIHRGQYGPPAQSIHCEQVPVPHLHPEEAQRVMVAILATGPNFNTNFAALALPVPVFGRNDQATLHIPGSDALGIVVDAGAAVKTVKVGQAVILDSWTGVNSIRGYETHDGFNAQLVIVDEERAIPVPRALSSHSPEQLAALLLTYGTAYRAVVERLAVGPGDTVLLMGGGKGTSFAGAQIAKALGAQVILMGSNPELGRALLGRGIADAFIDRRGIPAEAFGIIPVDAGYETWHTLSEPFRQAVYTANGGRPVNKIFEHTGGRNFPLLVSSLAENGTLAFFGATGSSLKGEYKETFFYQGRRFVLDARWVWMRQKQIIFRKAAPRAILAEIGLPPGRKGLLWGADAYTGEFVQAALERSADLAVIASRSREAEGIAALVAQGIPESHIIDRDQFTLPADMPDPLTEDGRVNPPYGPGFMDHARALGRAVWGVFGPQISPDFVVDRPDQSTLHFSTFLARDHVEKDEMSCGYVILQGQSNLSLRGSHMYRGGQAREVVRLLAEGRIVMEQEDLDITSLGGLPVIQQKMLDGQMSRPKGVALVQASAAGRPVAEYEAAYLGRSARQSDPGQGRYVDVHCADGIAIVTIDRPGALNALNEDLLAQLEEVIDELEAAAAVGGLPVHALVLRGAGRAFMAGADVSGFAGQAPETIEMLAGRVLRIFGRLENLPIPVVALIDGFALGGGNELALSAHYRIVTENASLGQPEIKLGIMPGYGGTQRLPRLIGPAAAAGMIVNGEPVDGRTAVALGLAGEFCPAATALRVALLRAQELAGGRHPLPGRNWDAIATSQQNELAALLRRPEVGDLLAAPAPDVETVGDLRAARRYAGRVALEALKFGYEHGFTAGLANDARVFGAIVASPSGQHWIGRFLAKDAQQAGSLTLLPPASAPWRKPV